MAYAPLDLVVTGTAIASAWGNQVRANFAASGAGVVTTAGDLLVGTGANSLARLAASTSGYVLTAQGAGVAPVWAPASTTPPACRVDHNADQAVAHNTEVALAFNSERFDNATMHDTSTNNSRITVPTAGVYVATLSIHWSSGIGANTEYRAGIRLNGGSDLARERFVVTNDVHWESFTVTTVHKLAASDYLQAVVFQTSGGSINVVAAGNYSPEFAASWLGPG